MPLHKMVNGQQIECSAEEEAAILAEWDANDPVKNPPKPPPPARQLTEGDIATAIDALARGGAVPAPVLARITAAKGSAATGRPD